MGSCASLASEAKKADATPSSVSQVEGSQPFREAAEKNPRRCRERESTFVLTDDILEQLRSRPASPVCLSPQTETDSAVGCGESSLGFPLSAESSHHYSGESESSSLPHSPLQPGSPPMPLPHTSVEISGHRTQLAQKMNPGARIFFAA